MMLNLKNTFHVMAGLLMFFKSHTTLHAATLTDDVDSKSISRIAPKLDEGMQVKGQSVTKKSVKSLSPVLKKEGDKFRLDSKFTQQVPTYAEMASMSYHLVSGRSEIANISLEKFINQGWKISGFSGLSGNKKFDQGKYDAKNLDLAGFVAFNPKTSEAVVTFHGSQDSFDWENNFMAEKVNAQEMGFKFNGMVHSGFAERYKSSKEEIYGILSQTYNGLSKEGQDKFHITTTGHSLGGGMTTIGYADLATDWAKQIWGDSYKNADNNRVRGFAMSPPRTFDEEAVTYLADEVGAHNIIIDTNDLDPVSKVGPGRTLTKWIATSSPTGPTAWVLKGAQLFGLISDSDPQIVAQKYGGYRHLGTKAVQSTGESIKTGAELSSDFAAPKKGILRQALDNLTTSKTKLLEQASDDISTKLAPFHYGTKQEHGLGFDARMIKADTLEARINKAVSIPAPAPPPAKKTFWQKVKSAVFR